MVAQAFIRVQDGHRQLRIGLKTPVGIPVGLCIIISIDTECPFVQLCLIRTVSGLLATCKHDISISASLYTTRMCQLISLLRIVVRERKS